MGEGGDADNGEGWKTLHIGNLHNNPQCTKMDTTQKDRDLGWVIEDADALGDQLVIICVDTNERSRAVRVAIEVVGWIEVRQAMREEGRAWPTYGGKRGLDK